MVLSYLSINDFILITLIGAALYLDLTSQRIPNYLTFPAIIGGLVFYTATDGLSGLWFSFLGLIVGLAIFFIPFAMGGMGGGDVKLLGAVGALQGWQFVLAAGLLTAAAGGVISIIYLIATGRLLRVLKKIAGFVLTPFFSTLFYWTNFGFCNRCAVFFATHAPEAGEPGKLPYGLAIAVGVILFFAYEMHGTREIYYSYLIWL